MADPFPAGAEWGEVRGRWVERGRSAGPSVDQADFLTGLLELLERFDGEDEESVLDPFEGLDGLSALVDSDFASDFESDFASAFESDLDSDFDSDARDLALDAARLSVL
jgi:hypothetical protein